MADFPEIPEEVSSSDEDNYDETVADEKAAEENKGTSVQKNIIIEEDWSIPAIKYEYLEHIPDRIYYESEEVDLEHVKDNVDQTKLEIHSWGNTLKESFEQAVNGMFGYITDINHVEMKETLDVEVEAEDTLDFIYKLMDGFLQNFCAEPNFLPRKVQILEFDYERFMMKARGFGEYFELDKHQQVGEVKAVSYDSMNIIESPEKCEVFIAIEL